MLTLEEIKKYNVENDREDTMYYVSMRSYRKGYRGWGLVEITGDPVFFMSDDLERIKKEFDYICMIEKNSLVEIEIMQALQIYNNDIEYESIKKFSTIE